MTPPQDPRADPWDAPDGQTQYLDENGKRVGAEPQEPRTGGVLVRWDGGYGMFVPNSYGTQTHRVFPLAEAEALQRALDEALSALREITLSGVGVDPRRIASLALGDVAAIRRSKP